MYCEVHLPRDYNESYVEKYEPGDHDARAANLRIEPGIVVKVDENLRRLQLQQCIKYQKKDSRQPNDVNWWVDSDNPPLMFEMFFAANLNLGHSHFRLKDHQICQQVHYAHQKKENHDPEGENDARADGLIELVVGFVLKVIR